MGMPPSLPAIVSCELAEGPLGTRQTLLLMARLVRESLSTPASATLIVPLAREIVGALPGQDHSSEAYALQAWVASHIRYVRDPVNVESLTPPAWMLGTLAGDCDDQSMLLAALLGAIGITSRFVAVGVKPGQFIHVYVEAFIGGRWVPLETVAGSEAASSAPYRMEQTIFAGTVPLGNFLQSGLSPSTWPGQELLNASTVAVSFPNMGSVPANAPWLDPYVQLLTQFINAHAVPFFSGFLYGSTDTVTTADGGSYPVRAAAAYLWQLDHPTTDTLHHPALPWTYGDVDSGLFVTLTGSDINTARKLDDLQILVSNGIMKNTTQFPNWDAQYVQGIPLETVINMENAATDGGYSLASFYDSQTVQLNNLVNQFIAARNKKSDMQSLELVATLFGGAAAIGAAAGSSAAAASSSAASNEAGAGGFSLEQGGNAGLQAATNSIYGGIANVASEVVNSAPVKALEHVAINQAEQYGEGIAAQKIAQHFIPSTSPSATPPPQSSAAAAEASAPVATTATPAVAAASSTSAAPRQSPVSWLGPIFAVGSMILSNL